VEKNQLSILEQTMLTSIVITQDIKETTQKNVVYERCRGCQKKGKDHTPEREELYELRRSQVEKRERAQSSKPMMIKRTKTNPPEIKNVYANGPIYYPGKSNYNQGGESSREEIDWTKDSEK
ncbi:10936_t:CDS:2, partial [Dentiscutata erythropus]